MPTASPPATCPRPGHQERQVTRAGAYRTADGARRLRWSCAGPDGDRHTFTTAEDGSSTTAPQVRCPRALHVDAVVAPNGTRQRGGQTWRRYRCTTPTTGDTHYFQVLVGTDRVDYTSRHLPPACADHPGSRVRRDGSYGTGAKKRQRYRCFPAGSTTSHVFTPPLPREVVELGADDCAYCEAKLSPHRGAQAGARHTPWLLASHAQTLNDLSLGASYAAASLAMRARQQAVADHLAQVHHQEVDFAQFLPGTAASYVGKAGARAWHLAADLAEQYAPLLYADTITKVRAREAAQRAANDAFLATHPGGTLASPIVYVLDDQPVYRVDRKTRRSSRAWHLLAVTEVVWHPGPTPADMPMRENRLRLARAYPTADIPAWRLVLDEIGVRPDFVVADADGSIAAAVQAQYGPGIVGLLPSLYHLHQNLRSTFTATKGTYHVVDKRKVPLPEVSKHLAVLARADLLNLTIADWSTWWDELVALTARLGAPVEQIVKQRAVHEQRVASALVLWQTHPHLPASNAAVENRLRAALDPFLTNRKQMYRNLARTNLLLDLAVARAQGAFTNLEQVAGLIRADNEANGGWAPAPRKVTDTQPPPALSGRTSNRRGKREYSSLLNPLLVDALAAERLAGGS